MTEATEPAIVYLDVDDEITSAAARLRGSEAQRIVFVLPYGSRLATSRINFRLLARKATELGKQLEIVAADASARALAGTAGLAVHASVAAFEGRDTGPSAAGAGAPAGEPGEPGAGASADRTAPGWPAAPVVPGAPSDGTETRVLPIPRAGGEPVPVVGRRRSSIRPRTAAVLAVVLLLIVGGGGLAAFVYLPSATIVLRPASQAIGPLELSIQARTDVASPDPTSLVVPAHQYSFDLGASQTFTTTGKKVTETAATGNVTFTWLGNQSSLTIPAGTQVSTSSGVAFATQASITLRKAHVGGRSTGTVSVAAVSAGTGGNVPAAAITQLPSGLQQQYGSAGLLSVNNPQPTAGGAHTETPQVSQQDVDAATATLQQALRDDLASQVTQATGIPAGTTLLESTGQVGQATPSVDPATLVGQAVATFDLGLTATGTALGVDTAPVQALAAQQLAGRVTAGWQLVDGSTSIQVGRPTVSGTSITFPVTAGAQETHAVDRAALLSQLRGLDLPRARAILDRYGEVDISLWPSWVTTIPGDTNRISLTIDATPQGGSPPPGGSPGPGGSILPAAS